MSRRAEQVASIMHQAIQSVLQEGLADPRAVGVVTVTRVKVTDDLSLAMIHVSIMPEKNESKYMHALEDAANYIRRRAADAVSLHRPPKIQFKLDKSLKRQAAVLNALSEVAHEHAEPPDQAASPNVSPESPGA